MIKLEPGGLLCATVQAPQLATVPYTAANLVNDYGLFEHGAPGAATHDNNPQGADMWCLTGQREDFSLVFDMGGCYPLGKVYIWNYNRQPDEKDHPLCGLRQVKLSYSLNQVDWHAAHPDVITLAKAHGKDDLCATNLENGEPFDFGGVTARYVRIWVPAVPGVGNYDTQNQFFHSFGLSKVRFCLGTGLAAVPDKDWSALMQNNDGWTGSDGVFTIPMDGCEKFGTGTDTTITFGDTLIDHVDPITLHRGPGMHMLHNSSLFLPNSVPDLASAVFTWGKTPEGADESLLCPPRDVQNDRTRPGYYWPQDSVVVNGFCHTYLLTVLDWLEGPEGFQFKVDGVAMAVCPVADGRVQWDKAVHRKTNLYYEDAGKSIYYGGCVLPNTAAAGQTTADGYVYLYGTIHQGVETQLCVARVLEDKLGDGMAWRFFDGQGWSTDIAASAPLAADVSCELSVSCCTGKLYKQQYLLVYQQKVNSPMVACRTSATPWGPFSEPQEVYFTEEVLTGRGIYTYNAKAHPHLSPAGEYLVSYNVNTVSWQMHLQHGDICRPKFIRLIEVTA